MDTLKPRNQLKKEGFNVSKNSRLMFDYSVFKNRELLLEVTESELSESFDLWRDFLSGGLSGTYFNYLVEYLKSQYNSEPPYESMRRQLNNAMEMLK